MDSLAIVHAYLCADGYVIKNLEASRYTYHMIGFRNTNLVLLKDFQKQFQSTFQIRPHLDPGERCRIGSKKIYLSLTNAFGSFYSHHWVLPDLEKDELRKWLRAYFDCDGWVFCKSHKNRHIGLDSVNKKGIYQIQEALASLGIISSIRKKKRGSIFSLIIYGRQNILLFSQLIGFLHPKKDTKLKETLADYVDYSWNFPEKEKDLKVYVKNLIQDKARVHSFQGRVRLCSKVCENLLFLQKELKRLYGIPSLVGKRTNGLGAVYYELSINKKKDVQSLVYQNLLSNKEKEKWLRLQK